MRVGFRAVNNTVKSVMPKKFQEGGAIATNPSVDEGSEDVMTQEEQVPKEQAPVDPGQMLLELAQVAMQALQGQDAQAAFQVCEGVVQLVQMIQKQQGGAPQ